ncbi:MAG: hypothetical protein K8F30_07260 [Taibaiella sp.]|nr:hypothetical protein [Taibaiella sp.]
MRYQEKIATIIGYVTIAFFLFAGLATAVVALQPFWLDEWFIIQNLKFRTADALWGQLEYMQQFPRLYLQALKVITETFNYSYSSLRLPSFAVHTAGVLLCICISRRLFKGSVIAVFTFILIYISFKTSQDYFVQVKQYTMEMLLGLVAIWQMMSIQKILTRERLAALHWILLYVSMATVTFFSYTYPILAASMLYVVVMRRAMQRGDAERDNYSPHIPVLIVLSAASVALFYVLDVMYVMHDGGMQDYWKEYIMKDGFNVALFFGNIYKLFAHQGAGALFEIIFSVLGIAGWVLGLYTFRKYAKSNEPRELMVAFATVVVAAMIVLFAISKLPLGAHRLNAFATPLLALLSINFLLRVQEKTKMKTVVSIVLLILLLAQAGNVFSSVINKMTSDEMEKKRVIYNHVSDCITRAQAKKLPVFVHRNIAYPSDVHAEVTGDWVLETLPAYDVRIMLPLHPVNNRDEVETLMKEQKKSAAMYIAADVCEIITVD